MNYRDLKIGKHGLPTWDALAPIVLRFTERQGEWQGKKLKIAVADDLELPADLRLLMYSRTSSINIIEDRVGWTISELSTAGILDRTRRGYYQVTELGRKLLDGPDEINRKLIHAQPLYVQHLAELKERQGRKLSVGSDVSEELPASEMLSQQVEAYNDEVATSLLQKIMESEPEFFEELVVKLLVAMGYKGPNGSAWVTQQSNDGGIDGVINQDALGAFSMSQLKLSANGGVALSAIVGHYFSNFGTLFLGVLVTLGVFTTALGLVTSFAQDFHKLFPKVSYLFWLRLTTFVSFVVANAGLDTIIAWSLPVLMLLYPLSLALILVSLTVAKRPYAGLVYKFTIAFTVLPAVLDMLNAAPAVVTNLAPVHAALAFYHGVVPFASLGLGWMVPTLVGFVVSLVWGHFRWASQATMVDSDQ